MAMGALAPGPIGDAPIRFDNPFGLSGVAGRVAAVVLNIGIALHWASLPTAAVCVVLRVWASRGVERQQMRWAAAGAGGAVVGLLLALPAAGGSFPRPPRSFSTRRCCARRWRWRCCATGCGTWTG